MHKNSDRMSIGLKTIFPNQKQLRKIQKDYAQHFSHRNDYTRSFGCQIAPLAQVPDSPSLFLLQGVDDPQKGKSGEVTVAGVERANPVKLEDCRNVGIGYEVAPRRHLLGAMWTADWATRVRGNYVVNWGTASIYANAASTLAGNAAFRNTAANTPVQTALKDITDGTSKTLLMSEIIVSKADGDVTSRGDIINDGWNAASVQFMTRNTPNAGTDQTSRCKNDDPQAPCIPGWDYNVSARSRHSGGVGVVMCDGAVRFVTDNVSLTTWQQLGNMNNGQTIADGF